MLNFLGFGFSIFLIFLVLMIYGFVELVRYLQRQGKSMDGTSSNELKDLIARHEIRIQALERKLILRDQEVPAPTRAVKADSYLETSASPRAVKTVSPIEASPVESKSSTGLEEAMAGKWFQWVALTALLFGLGYFLKLAFENNWITPFERVAMGWLIGCVFLGWGHHWFKKYPGWAHGLAGSGLAFLYLTTFAAYQYYALISDSTAFVVMIMTTTVGSILSVVNRRAVLAVLAVSGGFLTPLLVSTNVNHQVDLMGYLLVLNAGVIAVSIFGEWKFLRWLGFLATVFYCLGWSIQYYHSDAMGVTLGFYTAFYLLYASTSWVYDFQKLKDADTTDAAFSIFNAAIYFGSCYAMLSDQSWGGIYDWLSTLLALVLCVFYAFQSRQMLVSQSKEALYISSIFEGLAAAFLAVAIPICLKKEWITVGWSIEAVYLLWAGLKDQRFSTRQIAYGVMILVGIRLVFFDWNSLSTTVIFNERLIPYGAALGSVIVSIVLLDRYKSKALEADAAIPVLAIVGNLIALLYLSLEVSDYWNRQVNTHSWSPKGLSLSILWLIYATAMMVYGFWKNFRGLRLLAIMAFCITILKVFLFDLSELQGGYRVISLLVLGLILLAVSFGYQNRGKKPKLKE